MNRCEVVCIIGLEKEPNGFPVGDRPRGGIIFCVQFFYSTLADDLNSLPWVTWVIIPRSTQSFAPLIWVSVVGSVHWILTPTSKLLQFLHLLLIEALLLLLDPDHNPIPFTTVVHLFPPYLRKYRDKMSRNNSHEHDQSEGDKERQITIQQMQEILPWLYLGEFVFSSPNRLQATDWSAFPQFEPRAGHRETPKQQHILRPVNQARQPHLRHSGSVSKGTDLARPHKKEGRSPRRPSLDTCTCVRYDRGEID